MTSKLLSKSRLDKKSSTWLLSPIVGCFFQRPIMLSYLLIPKSFFQQLLLILLLFHSLLQTSIPTANTIIYSMCFILCILFYFFQSQETVNGSFLSKARQNYASATQTARVVIGPLFCDAFPFNFLLPSEESTRT